MDAQQMFQYIMDHINIYRFDGIQIDPFYVGIYKFEHNYDDDYFNEILNQIFIGSIDLETKIFSYQHSKYLLSNHEYEFVKLKMT